MNSRDISLAFALLMPCGSIFAATPPDPPQLGLTCPPSSTVVTCTVTASGGVPINNVAVTASPTSGTQQIVSFGTMTGGSTGLATFTYSSAFAGVIIAQGTADQPVRSGSLQFAAGQAPTQLQPPGCTAEAAVADALPYPVSGANGSVTVKSQDSCRTFVSLAPKSLVGLAVLDYGGGLGNRSVPLIVGSNIMPDQSTGPVDWTLLVTVQSGLVPVNPSASQAGLTCQFQPSPSFLTVPAAGAIGTISMSTGPSCLWSHYGPDSTQPGYGFAMLIQPPAPGQMGGPLPACCSTGPGIVYYDIGANLSDTGRTFVLFAGGKTINGQQAGPAPPSPTLACPSNNGTKGVQYSSALTATSGDPPYTFALTGGSLPAGLTLNPSGAISGTPATAGTSNFTAQVTDSRAAGVSGGTATAQCTITVDNCIYSILGPAEVPGLSQYLYAIGGPGAIATNIHWTIDKSTAAFNGTPTGFTATVNFENTQPDWITLKASFTAGSQNACAVLPVALVKVTVGTVNFATPNRPLVVDAKDSLLDTSPANGAPNWVTTYDPGSDYKQFQYNGGSQRAEDTWLVRSSPKNTDAITAVTHVTLTSPPENSTAHHKIQVGYIQSGSEFGTTNFAGGKTRILTIPTTTSVDWLSNPYNKDADLWPWYATSSQATGSGANPWSRDLSFADAPSSDAAKIYNPNADLNAKATSATDRTPFAFYLAARTTDSEFKADTHYFSEAQTTWSADFSGSVDATGKYNLPAPNIPTIITKGDPWKMPTEPSEIKVNVVPTNILRNSPYRRWNPSNPADCTQRDKCP
jgi:hypothetical protein